MLNASVAVMALHLLSNHRAGLSIPITAVRQGLETVRLPGRFQILTGHPERILDVAHNPQSARVLAEMLRGRHCNGRTLIVLAMLADKDIPAVIGMMEGLPNAWYLASLNTHRGASADVLADVIRRTQAAASAVYLFKTVSEAYLAAVVDAAVEDRVVVFGSFYAVGEILQLERSESTGAVVNS
jgi:dihydrofolate synthase/folylpolyglutamate synthase